MAKVGIIMRTKDRPILLKRAINSIENQSLKDWKLVIVNDGGETACVDQLVETVDPLLRKQIKIVHNDRSCGMEAASNIGLNRLDTKYVIIHDDDDRLDPRFLEKTTKFLDHPPHPLTKGVITHTERIFELIEGNTVKEVRRHPYNDWIQSVSIRRMLTENIFAPIAFLFDREACLEVGAFREDLPVLGDWDFNVRFLQKYEIGVIPEKLAYYHNRDDDGTGSYSSSVNAKANLHAYFDNFLRNEWLRNDIENGRTGIGAISNHALMLWDLAWDIKSEVKKGRFKLFRKKK